MRPTKSNVAMINRLNLGDLLGTIYLTHTKLDLFLIFGVQIFRGNSQEGTYDDPFLHLSGLLSLTSGQQVWVSSGGIVGMQGAGGTYYESWFAGHLIYALWRVKFVKLIPVPVII